MAHEEYWNARVAAHLHEKGLKEAILPSDHLPQLRQTLLGLRPAEQSHWREHHEWALLMADVQTRIGMLELQAISNTQRYRQQLARAVKQVAALHQVALRSLARARTPLDREAASRLAQQTEHQTTQLKNLETAALARKEDARTEPQIDDQTHHALNLHSQWATNGFELERIQRQLDFA